MVCEQEDIELDFKSSTCMVRIISFVWTVSNIEDTWTVSCKFEVKASF